MVIEKTWVVNKRVTTSGWGLEPSHIPSNNPTGAWGFDPVIKKPSDLKKLKFPQVEYDQKSSKENFVEAQELFVDILEVKLKGISRISFHLMGLYCRLRGLEQIMWDMCDEPNMLHEAMAFLEEGHRQLI